MNVVFNYKFYIVGDLIIGKIQLQSARQTKKGNNTDFEF